MNKYILYQGRVADEYKLAFERFLFNEEKHLHTQSGEGWITFSWLDVKSKSIQAQVHFHITDGIATSPFKAPFGSFEFASSLSAKNLFEFIKEVDRSLISRGVHKIVIKDAPQIYRLHQASTLSVLLTDLDFKIAKQEINSSIIVDDVLWRAKIADSEHRRLKQCEKESLTFQQFKISELKLVYDFINECREEREMSLSLTFQELKHTVEKFLNEFLLFGVYSGKDMIAAVVSIRVSQTILYNFYPAHSKAFDHLSPMVFLLDNQYKFCQANQIQILDLGTSSLKDKTNFSLLNFKSLVGGISSLKLTFEKELQ